MIHFDLTVFKEHWGKLPKILTIIGIILSVSCFSVLDILLYSYMINNLVFEGYETPIMIVILITELITICILLYAKHKTVIRAKKFKIEFSNGNIAVFDTVKSGLSFNKMAPFEVVVMQYEISKENTTNWKEDNRWYYLDGVYQPIETHDGISYYSSEMKTRIKIPRVFLEEKQFEFILDSICGNNVFENIQ